MEAEYVPVHHGGEFGYAFDSQKKCIAKSRIYLRVTVSLSHESYWRHTTSI